MPGPSGDHETESATPRPAQIEHWSSRPWADQGASRCGERASGRLEDPRGLPGRVPADRVPGDPGNDAPGVVDQIGDGVTDVAVGDRIFGTTMFGGTAGAVVLSAWAPVPETMTTEQAAAAAFAGIVAVRALEMLELAAGETLLIEGAAGGVESLASQIAIARGLTVIGTASENNHDYLRSLGVLPTTYGPGLAARVEALAPDEIDAVLDTAGSGSLADLIALATGPGRVVSLVDYAAPALGARLVTGTSGSPAAALREIAELSAEGRLTPG